MSTPANQLAVSFLQAFQPLKDPQQSAFDYRRMMIVGLTVLVLFFGGLTTWLALAPLTSASIAQGMVKVLGERQSIQHLEGGIIQEILIQEGAIVEKGEVMLRLDPTQHLARREILEGRLINLEAAAARFRAEREGQESLSFSAALEARAASHGENEILDGELRVFASRLETRKGQQLILKQRIERFEDEIEALNAQKRSSERQLQLIGEELEAARIVYEKGIFEKPRYLALQRAAARLEGEIGEFSATIAQAYQRIGETELQMIDLKNQWTSEAAGALQSVSSSIMDLEERMESVEDVLNRLEIVAPGAGAVVGLRFHTVGGVIGAGEHILDIVPAEAALVVEARVRPEDIDVVGAGLDCDVRLTAYSMRSTPPVPGTVMQVSADSLADESGMPYYRALVEVDEEAIAQLQGVDLYPGMPAEVYIKTGRRPALEYLLEPITRSLQRAFRE